MTTPIIGINWVNTDDESTVVIAFPSQPARRACACFSTASGPRIVVERETDDQGDVYTARLVALACDRCNRPCAPPARTKQYWGPTDRFPSAWIPE